MDHCQPAILTSQNEQIGQGELTESLRIQTPAVRKDREMNLEFLLVGRDFERRIPYAEADEFHALAQALLLGQLVEFIHMRRSELAQVAVHIEAVDHQDIALNVLELKR